MVYPWEIAARPEGIVDAVDIVVLAIEGITIGLLLFLLYLLRSVYELVRRDRPQPTDSSESDEVTPAS